MKNTLLAISVFALLGTGCLPSYMVKVNKCPDLRTIKPQPGKAALVIGRTTSFGGAVNFEHYLGRDFIGSTRGYGFFVTPMDTGDQFVTAQSENHSAVYLKAVADKTYYLQDNVSMGLMKAHVFLDPVQGDAMYKSMDGDCSFFARDTTKKVDQLEADEWVSTQEARPGAKPAAK